MGIELEIFLGSTRFTLPESSAQMMFTPAYDLHKAVSHIAPSHLVTKEHGSHIYESIAPCFILISFIYSVPLVREIVRTFSSNHLIEVTYPMFN